LLAIVIVALTNAEEVGVNVTPSARLSPGCNDWLPFQPVKVKALAPRSETFCSCTTPEPEFVTVNVRFFGVLSGWVPNDREDVETARA
jgi:hypothetical protein